MNDRRGHRAYVELKREAEGAVVRWEWGTLYLHDPRPYYALRWGFSAPKPLKKPPAKNKRAREYGFDEAGRLRVIRAPTEFEGKFGEEFFWYGDGWIMSQRYTHFDKSKGMASEFSYEGNRIVKAVQQTPRGHYEERYRYDGDRLVSVAAEGADGSERVFELAYHDEGSLAAIRDGGNIIFDATPPGLDELLEKTKRLLVDRVLERVHALGHTEPAYCLALVYTRDYYMLPPELGIGYETQRAAWQQADASTAANYVWSPEDWKGLGLESLRLDDPDLTALGTTIGHRLRLEGNDKPALDLLVDVAKKLAKQDLGGQFVKTSDFVVCALSLENGLNAASLASIPVAARKKLNAKGLLPSS